MCQVQESPRQTHGPADGTFTGSMTHGVWATVLVLRYGTFAPLYVKHGRWTTKHWFCLFTCLTTRCVHLEVVNSMVRDDFIMYLRRFINRRGWKKYVVIMALILLELSTSWRRVLKKWNQERIESELIQHGRQWIFQLPTATTMSGMWERLVQSVKMVLS